MNEPARTGRGSAVARAGILGNPSDGYGGRVIAISLPGMVAEVAVELSDQWDTAGLSLFDAAVQLLRSQRPELVAHPRAFSFTTTIPRQVGLSGSSALIIAALRALASQVGVGWTPVELAKTALEVETDVLGWSAGPQDRVVQEMEGLLDMDFARPWDASRYHRLEITRLPPLFLAWRRTPGVPSDVVHSSVRQRWLQGDPLVVATMQQFADLARAGRKTLDDGSAGVHWPDLLRQSIELRRRHWIIDPTDTALIDIANSLGAGAALAGSGGAIVGCPTDSSRLEEIETAYERARAGFLVISP